MASLVTLLRPVRFLPVKLLEIWCTTVVTHR